MATHGLPCILRVLRLRRRQVTDRRNSVMYAEKVGFIVSIFWCTMCGLLELLDLVLCEVERLFVDLDWAWFGHWRWLRRLKLSRIDRRIEYVPPRIYNLPNVGFIFVRPYTVL